MPTTKSSNTTSASKTTTTTASKTSTTNSNGSTSSTSTGSADNDDSKLSAEEYQKKYPLVHHMYKYQVTSFQMIFEGIEKPVEIDPGCITFMYIEKNYDEGFYPLCIIRTVINPRLREYVIFNKTTVKFRLRLQCITMNSNGVTEGTDDIFNTIFIPIIKDEDPFYDEAVYNKTAEQIANLAAAGANAQDLGTDNMTADQREDVEYLIWVEKDLNNSKNLVNDCYSGANLTTVVVDMLNHNGFDAMLISPPDNSSAIDTILVPPMNLLNVFKYLSDTYGMHSTGTTAFFDYRCVYVLNKSGHPNCVEKGEYPKTIFTIHTTDMSEHYMPGTLEQSKKKEYHMFPDPHAVKINNASVFNDQINGNSLKMINSKKNSSATISGTGDQRGSGNTRVENNNDDNDYSKVQYANSVSEMNKPLKMTIMDNFMWALTPNKEFIINWEDTRVAPVYNGYYRIKICQYMLAKNGDWMTLTTRLDMVKKEDISAAEKAAIDKEVVPVATPKSQTLAANVGNTKLKSATSSTKTSSTSTTSSSTSSSSSSSKSTNSSVAGNVKK